jgi:hypothetical protein
LSGDLAKIQTETAGIDFNSRLDSILPVIGNTLKGMTYRLPSFFEFPVLFDYHRELEFTPGMSTYANWRPSLNSFVTLWNSPDMSFLASCIPAR